MVCKNCGKELPEGTKFCTSCGTPCEEAAPQTAAPQTDAAAEGAKEASETVTPAEAPKEAEAPKAEAPKEAEAPKAEDTKEASEAVTPAVEAPKAPEAPKTPEANGGKSEDAKKMVFLCGGVALLVLLILLCSGAIFGSSPKKAFKAYVTGQYSCDYKKILNNSMYTKKAMKALDLYDEDDYEDDYEDLKDYYEDLKDDWKDDGIKYKVSIDIKDVEKIKKSDREFKWAKEFMEDYYDCDADKIKQFAIVEARVKADYYEDGDRDKDYDVDTGRTQYLLVKIGGNWYMTEFSRDDIEDYLKTYYK